MPELAYLNGKFMPIADIETAAPENVEGES